jgi:hypothetical protein
LILKYQFHDSAAVGSKKRKLSENKMLSIVEYSYVKIPAFAFVDYLDKYVTNFIDDCIEQTKKDNL